MVDVSSTEGAIAFAGIKRRSQLMPQRLNTPLADVSLPQCFYQEQ